MKSEKFLLPTVVRGIRAEISLWKWCDDVARREHLSRNSVVVRAMRKYCEEKDGKNKEQNK